MTFHPQMRRIIERTIPKIERGKVCELGNQRFTAGRDYPSTQAFYEFHGLEYLALDANESMGAKIWDLNDAGAGYKFGQFDLVTNNGTSEHVFDQCAVFMNVHGLCKEGGYMVHVLPFVPWLNHGFFNYNPIFFRDLARANEYAIEEAMICTREGDEVPLDETWAYREKRPVQLAEHVQKMPRDVFCAFVFKKVVAQPFRKPYQGKYVETIQDDRMKAAYG